MGKTMAVGVHCIIALLILSGADLGRSDGSDHRYKEGDFVPLYANKVGPFHNPSETYRYFDLPFCSPDAVKEKREALGEVLNGDRLVSAPYKLEFRRHKDPEVACKKTLTKEEVARFRSAVNKDYYFQMYYDDLPIWGFIGKVDKEGKDPSEYKTYLYKHIHFDLYYNKDRVIEVNVGTDPNALVDLTEDKQVDVEFMYTVEWKQTTTPFDKRMDKYSQASSLPPLVNAYELYTVTRRLISFSFPRINPKNAVKGIGKVYDTVDTAQKPYDIGGKISDLTAVLQPTPPGLLPPPLPGLLSAPLSAATAGLQTPTPGLLPPTPPAATAGLETTPSPSGGKECSTDKLQMILGGIILFYMFSNY